MKIFNNFIFAFLAFSTTFSVAKRIDFTESPYEMQAPQEVLDIVEEAVSGNHPA